MKKLTHNELVASKFAPQANAYVSSKTHAQGADLELLKKIVKDQNIEMALDIGCGGGHASYAIAPFVEKVIASDLLNEMLKAVELVALNRGIFNIETKIALAENLPFEDESFDFVTTRYSAHHWRDLPKGVKEAARVLKKESLAVFIDVCAPCSPLADTWLNTMDLLRDPSHVRDYSLNDWQSAVLSAGFEIELTKEFNIDLEFKPWVERIGTPQTHIDAILYLQNDASDELKEIFKFKENGDFSFNLILIKARKT